MATVPNPQRQQPANSRGIITQGSREAIDLATQLANGAAYRLETWRIHQRRCESCAEVPDSDKCGPGCNAGWPLWCKWRNAQDHADGMARLLLPDPDPVPGKPASEPLTLFGGDCG